MVFLLFFLVSFLDLLFYNVSTYYYNTSTIYLFLIKTPKHFNQLQICIFYIKLNSNPFAVQTVVTTITTMPNNVMAQCHTPANTIAENPIASNASIAHAQTHAAHSPLKTILSIITTSSPTLSSSSSTNSTSTMTSNSILTNTIYNPQYLRLMQFSASYYRRHSISGTDTMCCGLFFYSIFDLFGSFSREINVERPFGRHIYQSPLAPRQNTSRIFVLILVFECFSKICYTFWCLLLLFACLLTSISDF